MTPDSNKHEHNHSHEWHSHWVTNISYAFFFAIGINIIFVIIEAFFWFKIHSLALLSDAWHNAMDVLNLILSWLAIWVSWIKNSDTYTYWYKRASIISALINSILLIVTAIYLIFEAINRIWSPVETVWTTMMIVASIWIFINWISGWMLMRGWKEDINIKSAYMHLLWDALVSLGVVIGWAIIYFTWYSIVDPIISIIVSIIMMVSVYDILKKSIRMNFDGVPHDVDVADIKNSLLSIKWVLDAHHIHIWALSTTKNALTVHLVLDKWINEYDIKKEIKHELLYKNIHHSTIETSNKDCCDDDYDC